MGGWVGEVVDWDVMIHASCMHHLITCMLLISDVVVEGVGIDVDNDDANDVDEWRCRW